MISMASVPSYRKVNYTLRPAKNIERKMIAEACSRLQAFGSLLDYRYIGFGSPFFSDFRLFHKALGFRVMINIESESGDSLRFEFNRPFCCIRMMYGKSSDVLPQLGWKGRQSVVWLDYDQRLGMDMLEDIDYVTANLEAPSVILITVESKAAAFAKDGEKVAVFLDELGDSLAGDIGRRDLAQTRFARTLHRVIDDRIRETLSERNAASDECRRIEYKQVFNFVYDDGTPMLTVGGVLVERRDLDIFTACDFSSLGYFSAGRDAYEIVAPRMTFKEQRHLDAQLPGSSAQSPGLTRDDVDAYRQVYRYFPAFTEVEL